MCFSIVTSHWSGTSFSFPTFVAFAKFMASVATSMNTIAWNLSYSFNFLFQLRAIILHVHISTLAIYTGFNFCVFNCTMNIVWRLIFKLLFIILLKDINWQSSFRQRVCSLKSMVIIIY